MRLRNTVFYTGEMAWAVALGFAACFAVAADEPRLQVDRPTGRVEWNRAAFQVFGLTDGAKLRPELDAQATKDGVLLTLRLRNDDAVPRAVAPTFPNIEVKGTNAADHRLLRYCFPARSARIGRDNVSDRAFYSGICPVQFLSVDHPACGSLSAVVCDTNNVRKLFGVDKTDQTLRLFAEYESRTLAPGETWTLPTVLLCASEQDWHAGLEAYRRWLATWYRPAAPRRPFFREVFNFRVCYLNGRPGVGRGVFDAGAKTWSLVEAVGQDAEAFGGVDFVHLFDWSQTPEQGRVGDYSPWVYLGGAEPFRRQLQALRTNHISAGLYLEGYLVSPESKAAQALGRDGRITDEQGRQLDLWGGGYVTMCPHVPAWQDYLAATCRRVVEESGAAGLYVDEFGFLTQYRCFNPAHAPFHAKGAHMMAGEREALRKIRAAVGERAVLYTEEIPTDAMTQFTDGAYTASVKMSLNKGLACPINLTRFALPDFKTIELISEEALKNELPALRATFFNGEGVYLSGDARAFSPDGLALIRKTHALLREYADAFTGQEPAPLVPTLNEAVCANRFPAGRRTVWTLQNAGSQPCEGPVLRVPHRAGARYRDAWNGAKLKPAPTGDGGAVISLRLGAGEVGCVVQSW